MKRIYNVSAKVAEYKDLIDFLNTPAIDFYKGRLQFKWQDYQRMLKGTILYAITFIERVFKATFNCGLSLKTVDVDLLRKMFPNACDNIFMVKTREDAIKMGRFLENLRNCNAHYVAFTGFLTKEDYPQLAKQRKMHPDVEYLSNGLITMAGVMFIVLNFHRELTASNLVKQDYNFSIVLSGEYKNIDASTFSKEISRVNLEMPLRTINDNSFEGSILGQFSTLLVNGEFNVTGEDDCLSVSGSFENNQIKIKKGSVTKTFYKNDYTLTIEDMDNFIKLSNQLPEFALVDTLYDMGVSTFTKETYDSIINNKDLDITKLNYPKFYADKIIKILFLPKTMSDYRILSSQFSLGVMGVFLGLEGTITRNYRPSFENDYSDLKTCLLKVGVPTDLCNKCAVVRNFASHGYIFGEGIQSFGNTSFIEYCPAFVLDVMSNLLAFFREHNKGLYEQMSIMLKERFVTPVLSLKYRNAITASIDFINHYPNPDYQTIIIKDSNVKHSFLNADDLAPIFDAAYDDNRILDIKTPFNGINLYLGNNPRHFRLLYEFVDDHGFVLTKVSEGPVVIKYSLAKNI